MSGHRVVVVGTSAGGVAALQDLLRGIPPDFPAAICVVMHMTPHLPTYLPHVLKRAGRLPAYLVEKPLPLAPGKVYVAPPDHHLIVTKDQVKTNRGPRENWNRPSVDVLFRSAAHAHGPRVIGVVLTGFLDDGTAGLAAVKREGGVTIVQDPDDATFPDMPLNAIQNVKVDHCVPLSEIPKTLIHVVKEPVGSRSAGGISEEVAIETAIAKESMNGRQALEKIGTPSTFTCPECQGPLWELKDGQLVRFRCQVGHAFSAESMLTAQQDVVERSLWVALGAIQSRVALWRRIADRMDTPHLKELAQFYRSKEKEAERDMNDLREILTRNGDPKPRAKGSRGGSPPLDAEAFDVSAARRPRTRRLRTRGRSPQRSPKEG